MKKKTSSYFNVKDLFLVVLKNKILFVGTILLFSLVSLVFSNSIEKQYEAKISLNHQSDNFFIDISVFSKIDYDNLQIKNRQNTSYKYLYYSFISKLSSIDNFSNYLILKTKFPLVLNQDLKSSEKMSDFLKKYLSENFYLQKSSNLVIDTDVLLFKYPESIKGSKILNEYVSYELGKFKIDYRNQERENIQNRLNLLKVQKDYIIKRQVLKKETEIANLKNQISNLLDKSKRDKKIYIYNLEQSLKSSKALGLKESVILNKNLITNEKINKLYEGQLVINSEIENTKDSLSKLELNFDYSILISKLKSKEFELDRIKYEDEIINLEYKIQMLNEILNYFDGLKFQDWNPILSTASEFSEHVYPNNLKFLAIGIIFGLITFFLLTFVLRKQVAG